jgi:glyoxylase-like metal-dependent hydrolase (beta-lactamase superfamily II)
MTNIERIQCGNGNCYLICEGANAVLVDTSRTQFKDKILDACKNKNVKLIFLTHGHIDHIQNTAYLSTALHVPIAMHQADYELSKNNMLEPMSAHKVLGKLILGLTVKSFKQDMIPPFEPSVYLQEGDSLEKFGVQATVIELPGHTKGSIGLRVGETDIIVGDALMNMFRPSKSLLYGDRKMMEKSVERLNRIRYETVYFGHGKPVKKQND